MISFMILLWAAAIQTTVSQDTVMEVNYYTDQNCTKYSQSINITTGALDGCIEYNITGAGSFNVANCYTMKQFSGCQCTWFTEPNCQGMSVSAGMLADGSRMNKYLADPTQLLVENCGQTQITFQEPVSALCQSGWYVS
jgi:hypothetical protein